MILYIRWLCRLPMQLIQLIPFCFVALYLLNAWGFDEPTPYWTDQWMKYIENWKLDPDWRVQYGRYKDKKD